jgi:hypothetical protein
MQIANALSPKMRGVLNEDGLTGRHLSSVIEKKYGT